MSRPKVHVSTYRTWEEVATLVHAKPSGKHRQALVLVLGRPEALHALRPSSELGN